MSIDIDLTLASVVNYAGTQNFIAPLQQLSITNNTDQVWHDLEVRISADPEFAQTLTVKLAQLDVEQCYRLLQPEWVLHQDWLSKRSESMKANVLVEVWNQEQQLAQAVYPIEVLAYNEWSGFRQLPELLTAFVQPNSHVISELQRKASDKLLKQFGLSLDGYQSANREAVMRQIAAVYAAVSDWGIHYANPPASFTDMGQKIRLPSQIQQERMGTCLDTCLLLASCLEQVGLNPLIFLDQTHAWVGCWLIDQHLTQTSVDDAAAIRKRIDAGEMLAIESTGVTPQVGIPFAQAVRVGAERLSEARQHSFQLAIDVRRSRQGLKILPLSLPQDRIDTASEQHEQPQEQIIDEISIPPLGLDVIVNSTSEVVTDRNRIDVWRSKLLDLTLRNKLINFKPNKQSVPLSAHQPAAIEDLIAQGKSLKIKSLLDLMPVDDPRSSEQQARATQASLQQHLTQQALTKNELMAELSGDELGKRLTEIFRTARTAQEEGGSNTLFLVFGMLQWSDHRDSSRKMLAPLLMVPVSLERQSVNSAFSLRRHDDDSVVNPTLLQLLEHQFNLKIPLITGAAELPQDESGVDVAKIWSIFRGAVVDLSGFELLPTVSLGMFSFTKYLMWKDLTDRLDQILKSPLVRHLVQRDEHAASPLTQGNFIQEDQLDEKRHPQDLFVPADCDSSQLAAVNAAADGLSFVLEGPPGTGKSQTITNMIADALARGKTVLFVSEKIAALSVVHDRLKKLGLAPFLLELHSAKASKSEVLGQFDRALKTSTRHQVKDWQQEADRLNQKRQGLNDYVSALHQRHSNGLTVFQATSRLICHSDYPACGFGWRSAANHTPELLDEMRETVRQIASIAELVPQQDQKNLRLIQQREWLPHWQRQLEQHCQQFQQAITALIDCSDAVSELLVLPLSTASLTHYAQFDQLCGVLLQYQPDYLSLLNAIDSVEQPDLIRLLEDVARHTKTLQSLEQQLSESWSLEVCEQPVKALSSAWRQASGYWWFKKWLAQFRIRSALSGFHAQGKRPVSNEVLPLLALIGSTQQARSEFEQIATQAKQYCGAIWQRQHTDLQRLAQAKDWLVEYDQRLADFFRLEIDEHAVFKTKMLQQFTTAPRALQPSQPTGAVLIAWQRAYQGFCEQYRLLLEVVGLDADALLVPTTSNAMGELRRVVRGWQDSLRYLRDWCNWQQTKRDSERLGLQPLLRMLDAGQAAWSEAPQFFEYSYADWWLGQVLQQTPALTRFAAVDHERKIQEFRVADEQFAELTRQYIYAKLADKIPASDLAPPQTPLGILKREIQKKSRHMPVRKLLSTTADLLSHLAPCMLMSPLSVAQYLDAARTQFDLVIFDEASQIPTWDAIGVIARGKQVIVVGDPKQLPPTSFFAGSSDGDGSDGDVDDLESILDECMGSGMRVHTLKWHYRSQRESLITFSNRRYYDSQLITFPSPVNPDDGVTFHRVVGTYQRAGARNNRQEAEAIVAFIRQHFQSDHAEIKSVGVVTFSQAQQKLVEDLLDAARQQDPALDRSIQAQHQEPLFVKNLENVQGDERDIILFSICYGPDETGRVSMNFGPLNREGGHRRLNVAITRAKTQVHIFSTLHPDQLDLSRTKARGIADLKHYLQFAIQGESALIAQTAPTGLAPESPFEIEVMNYLLDQGWQVHCQVGCSSYRIDLAVIDPRAEGRYLLAVECDGASYHSAATARDRDKLRQMVLERLGWTVHRIWSTEWWNNRAREQARLIDALEQAISVQQPDQTSAKPIAEEIEQSTHEQSDEPVFMQLKGCSDADWAYSPPLTVKQMTTVLPYTPVDLPTAYADLFFELTESTKILQMMRQVIDNEGPVLDRVIIRRIIQAYGFKRAGNRIQDRLSGLLSSIPTRSPHLSQPVYWPEQLDAGAWSDIRLMGDRDLSEIPVIEMANAGRAVLALLVVADEEVIIREMGVLFGAGRVTRQAQDKLRAGLDWLKSQGAAEETTNGLKLVV
jgi:very-short-patch-repair endonuclease